MSLHFEKVLIPWTRIPDRADTEHDDQKLNISVVFTSVESTLAALARAASLASNLRARITLLVPQVVPHPLPLESPPVLLDWSERRFRVIAGASRVQTNVHLYLCRDRGEMLIRSLKPKAPVVIGGPKAWGWPFTSEKRLARKLRRHGYEVIFTETE